MTIEIFSSLSLSQMCNYRLIRFSIIPILYLLDYALKRQALNRLREKAEKRFLQNPKIFQFWAKLSYQRHEERSLCMCQCIFIYFCEIDWYKFQNFFFFLFSVKTTNSTFCRCHPYGAEHTGRSYYPLSIKQRIQKMQKCKMHSFNKKISLSLFLSLCLYSYLSSFFNFLFLTLTRGSSLIYCFSFNLKTNICWCPSVE
jgi:hypothetical protein